MEILSIDRGLAWRLVPITSHRGDVQIVVIIVVVDHHVIGGVQGFENIGQQSHDRVRDWLGA